ncbi:response regulator [Massilia sp. Dwa41.01b]|nr:response regulator [Massilia sp. Dwa41.01b]QNB01407.1 response regulator [Massilia sp. Se16.2.3]
MIGAEGEASSCDLVLCGARHPHAFALAGHKAGTVLLAMSAPGDEALRDRLLAAGYNGYIGLPIEADSLVDEVEAFLPPPALLLVDDDPFMLGVLADQVEGQGWRVLRAASGEEALALLEREAVAVVLSDHWMPGMRGAALLAEVRRRRPSVFRMLLSGQSADEAIARALACGDAERFHQKPWQGAALLDALHEAFRLQRGRGPV